MHARYQRGNFKKRSKWEEWREREQTTLEVGRGTGTHQVGSVACMAVPCGKSCPPGGCGEIHTEPTRRQRELKPRQLL